MRFRPESYDGIVRRLVEGTAEEPGRPNMLVPYFMMAAYAYEELGDPFLTDAGWDWLCAQLDQHWDAIEHRHKHLIDRDALATGTASYLVGRFPTIVKGAAKTLMSEYSRPEDVGRPVVDLSDLLGTPKPAASDIDDLLGGAVLSLEDLL
jgi:hypothetical protein